jgi:hypothetical protein
MLQVWESYKRGNVAEIIDPAIFETCDQGQALRCIYVGLLCTEEDTSLRPSMSTVSVMLSTNSVTVPDPTKPAFVKVPRETMPGHPCPLQNENDYGLSLASSSATTSSYVSSSAPSSTPQVTPSNARCFHYCFWHADKQQFCISITLILYLCIGRLYLYFILFYAVTVF